MQCSYLNIYVKWTKKPCFYLRGSSPAEISNKKRHKSHCKTKYYYFDTIKDIKCYDISAQHSIPSSPNSWPASWTCSDSTPPPATGFRTSSLKDPRQYRLENQRSSIITLSTGDPPRGCVPSPLLTHDYTSSSNTNHIFKLADATTVERVKGTDSSCSHDRGPVLDQ